MLLILCSCRISQQSGDSTLTTKAAGNSKSTSKLIFANFKITKDSAALNSNVKLTQIKITDGSLKKSKLSEIYKPTYENELRCVIENSEGEVVYEINLEHPLFKKYEYNKDDGSIGVKEVVLKEAVFSIRAEYYPEMKDVHIFEKLSSSEEKEIAKLELKK
jgi:hypothetical protein